MRQWHCYIDGQEYGPVCEEIAVKWVREQRLAADDYVWTEGMADWQPVQTVPEFSQLVNFGATSVGVAPAVHRPPTETPGQGLAVAGMVLGIVSLVMFCVVCLSPVLAIVGLSLSSSALRTMRQAGHSSGRGMAIAGLVTSLIAMGIGGLWTLGMVFG